MRVLVNGQCTAGRRTGIGHYTAEVVRCLTGLLGPECVTCYQPDPFVGLKQRLAWLRDWADSGASPSPGSGAAPGTPRLSWRQWALWKIKHAGLAVMAHRLRAESRRGHDLYHEPNFIPLPCDLPTVVTVHDLSVLLHPEWHPADRVADFERRFRAGLKQCVHVLTISENGRREVIRTLGLPPDRVTRTYMGVRPHLRPLPAREASERVRALGLPESYLLHVGTVEPRKNLLTLMRAYCDLPAAVREAFPLVLVGGWGWNSGDVNEYLRGTARDRGVVHLGYVADADLPAVYNAARALVFPTRYEGFGMPTVEMMACGGAVIASTAGAVAEVAAGRGHLVHPDDVEGWRDAMRRVIEDDEWHAALCAGGPELAARFTWEQCAADTLAAYEAVLGRRQSRAA